MMISFTTKYEDQTKTLLQENSYYLPWGEKATATWLVVENDIVIAVGSLWNNSLHPYRAYIGVYVQPDARRKGIGTSLIQHLMSKSLMKKFQTSISSKDSAAVAFLEKNKFHVARKCYEPDLKNEAGFVPTTNAYEVAYVELTSTQRVQLIQLQQENYRQFHQAINPLKDSIPFTTWQEIILENIDEAHSFVLVIEGEIEAYLLTYESEQEHALDIGYIGGKDIAKMNQYLSFYRNVTHQLLAQFETVSIEADNVDPFAFALLNAFNYDESDSWDAYIL